MFIFKTYLWRRYTALLVQYNDTEHKNVSHDPSQSLSADRFVIKGLISPSNVTRNFKMNRSMAVMKLKAFNMMRQHQIHKWLLSLCFFSFLLRQYKKLFEKTNIMLPHYHMHFFFIQISCVPEFERNNTITSYCVSYEALLQHQFEMLTSVRRQVGAFMQKAQSIL